MKEMETRSVLGVAIAITMVLLAVSAVPAMACPCESQEPIDVIGQQNVPKDVRTSNWSDPASAEALIEQLSEAGDDADAVYASLPHRAQAEVLEYLKVTQVKTSVSTTEGHVLADGGRGCNSRQYQVDWCNALGQTLFSYFQKIDWCYDGSKITNTPTRTRWGEVYVPLWSYDGHIGNSESGGINQSSYEAWTQGEFKLCAGGDIGCIWHKYPWIDMTVYGDGTHSASSSVG